MGLGPTHVTSFYLGRLCKDPLRTVTSEVLELGTESAPVTRQPRGSGLGRLGLQRPVCFQAGEALPCCAVGAVLCYGTGKTPRSIPWSPRESDCGEHRLQPSADPHRRHLAGRCPGAGPSSRARCGQARTLAGRCLVLMGPCPTVVGTAGRASG